MNTEDEEGGGSPLDLNNLPEDCTRGDDQDPSTSVTSGNVRSSKNKLGIIREDVDDEEEEEEMNGKVYKCRFCSLKFCKSQALGGHMNRHRQERETESLNKARQLVFGMDSHRYGPLLSPTLHFPPPPLPHHHHHLPGAGGYHHQPPIYSNNNPRLYSSVTNVMTSSPLHVGLHQAVYNTSLPQTQSHSQSLPPHLSHYPHHHDYFLGHPNYNYTNNNLGSNATGSTTTTSSSNYTCVGAPVVTAAAAAAGRGNLILINNNRDIGTRAAGGSLTRNANWGIMINNNNNPNHNSSSNDAPNNYHQNI